MSTLYTSNDANRCFALDSSRLQTAKRLHDPTLSNRCFAIFFVVTILIALTLLFAFKTNAQSSWTGPGGTTGTPVTGNWNTSTNWSPNGVPTSSTATTLIFGGSGSTAYTSTNNVSSLFTFGTMTLNSTASVTEIIAGSSFNINSSQISQTNSGAFDIQNNFDNDTTNASTTLTLTGNGTGFVTLSGVITEKNSSKNVSVTKTGTSTFALSGSNSYTGVTTISGGILSVNTVANGGSNSSIGASAVAASNLVIDGGTLKYTGTGDSTNRVFTIGASGATIDASGSGALNFTSTTGLTASGSGNRTFTLTGTNTGANTLRSAIPDPTTGTTSLLKNGAGSWTLTGGSSYSGSTTVSGGTLTIDNSGGAVVGSIGSTSSVTVNSSGTLILSGSAVTSRIANAATMTLNGGTFRLSGVAEGTAASAGIGALTLSSGSVIDLASTSLLHFAASNLATWTGTLSIWNWTGTPITGGGAEEILFGTSATGLNATQLLQVQFYSDSGTTAFAPGAVILSTGEIVPTVPEPATWLGGALTLGVVGWRTLKSGKLKRPRPPWTGYAVASEEGEEA